MDKLTHAKHNESACHYLNKRQDLTDWVIVTAFYSAVHFVEHKIFPYKLDETTFHTLDQYIIWAKMTFPRKDKHTFRAELVSSVCPAISAEFNWLLSNTHTVRYYNYEFHQPRVASKIALENLQKIKSFCTAKNPPLAPGS
jgi:hypothetical protein